MPTGAGRGAQSLQAVTGGSRPSPRALPVPRWGRSSPPSPGVSPWHSSASRTRTPPTSWGALSRALQSHRPGETPPPPGSARHQAPAWQGSVPAAPRAQPRHEPLAKLTLIFVASFPGSSCGDTLSCWEEKGGIGGRAERGEERSAQPRGARRAPAHPGMATPSEEEEEEEGDRKGSARQTQVPGAGGTTRGTGAHPQVPAELSSIRGCSP